MTKRALPRIPLWDATQFNKERRSWEKKCDVKVSWRSPYRWKWELSLPLLSALFNVNFAIDWRLWPGFPQTFPACMSATPFHPSSSLAMLILPFQMKAFTWNFTTKHIKRYAKEWHMHQELLASNTINLNSEANPI